MPKRSSGLSRSVSRWAYQVSASLGATLIAAVIVQSLPRAVPDAPPPAPELTSGGKFAARVARAYDGLDTMPLPHVDAPRVAPPSIVPAAFVAADSGDLAGLGAALREPLLDGPAAREHAKPARPARVPARAAGRRTVAPTDAAPAQPLGIAAVESSDDGLLHQVVSKTRQVWGSTASTTRDAWSATASAGSSLVSHLLPE